MVLLVQPNVDAEFAGSGEIGGGEFFGVGVEADAPHEHRSAVDSDAHSGVIDRDDGARRGAHG